MFDDILKAVKEHFAANPQLTADVPADQQDALHNEVAQHVANTVATTSNAGGISLPAQAATESGGGFGDLLEKAKDVLTSGNPVVTAVEGGLVGALAGKLGLGNAATGAIAASLPGLIERFTSKNAAAN